MVWDDSEPTVGKPANTIHELIQDVKVEVRERFEAYNGTIKEHGEADTSDIGKHPLSKIPFTLIVDDWSNRPTTNLVSGSLIYIKAPSDKEGLYRIDDDHNYIRITAISHVLDTLAHPGLTNMYTDSNGDLVDPHPQYAPTASDVSSSFTFQNDVNVTELELEEIGDTINDPIDISHESEDFHTAHGDKSISKAMLKSEVMDIEDVSNVVFTGGTDSVSFPVGSTLFVPWTQAPDDSKVRAVVIGNDSVYIMDEDLENILEDGVSIALWYIPPEEAI